MTEQEKKDLLREIRIYMTDPKNSQKWKMAPYFSSVVLNFVNNYADKFDDPERIMNVVHRLKVEPFRKDDDYFKWNGVMVGNNVVHKFIETEMEKVSPEELEEMQKALITDDSYKDKFIKFIDSYYETEQEANEASPISLRLNQDRDDINNIVIEEFKNESKKEDDNKTEKEGEGDIKENNQSTKKDVKIGLKTEKLAELFSSLGKFDDLKVDERYETSSFYNLYKTLTHELAHGMAHYKSENKAIEEMSIKAVEEMSIRDRYLGGVNFDELNYIHEGMTEWLAQKAVKNLSEKRFSGIYVSYKPFVVYAEIIHTLFPEGFYDIYFNGSGKLKKYENIYPDLSLEDLITKYGKAIQDLQNFEDQEEKDTLSVCPYYDNVKYQFSDLKNKILKYAKEGIISKDKSIYILFQLNWCYSQFSCSKIFPIDFLGEGFEKKYIDFQKLELENRLDLSKCKSAKQEGGDCEILTYLDIKQDENEEKNIFSLKADKIKELTNGTAKIFNLSNSLLDKESEILDTKIWVLKDGTVGFGDNAIKAFRQHNYDIEDAVMIDCKYEKMPQITKQDNQFSIAQYEEANLYEKFFIRPDYETKQKLSKEQSCAVLSMALSAQPQQKNYGIMFFDNLEFDEKVLKDFEQNFSKTKLIKVSGKTMTEKQKQKDEKIGLIL